jgi:hypothetical protein
MAPRWVRSARPMLIFLFIALPLVGCGPDPAKQALLEQLVTTRSAITAGVTPVTLRDREIALRTAAGLANDRLSDSQRNNVTAAVRAISQARTAWSDAIEGRGGSEIIRIVVEPMLDRCATRLDTAIASLS